MDVRTIALAVAALSAIAVSGCATSPATPGYQVMPTATLGQAMTADPARAGVGGTINPATGISESGGE